MANNVEIIVEASVADALVKLDLVKHELKDVGDAGGVTAKKIGDPNDRSSLSSAMRNLEGHLNNFNGSGPMGLGHLETGLARMGGRVLGVTNLFDRGAQAAGQWISGLADGIPVLGSITDTMGAFVSGLGSLVAVLGPAAVGVGILAGAFIVLDTILNAAATIIGTVVAIVGDLVAPVTLVAGLLGGLGLGFILAAKRAADGGGKLSEFSNKLDKLKSMFGKTTDILAHAFLPVLNKLADGAQHALLFIDKLAREPLPQAFRDLATKGVQMVTHALQYLGGLLAKPFRLAVQIAFGQGRKGGNEISSAVSGLWNQFTNYLFGYTRTHPVRLDGHVIQINQRAVDGALQPLLNWFNRHHFTEQGQKIGREILKGLAPLAKPLGQFLVQVFKQAAIQSAHDFTGILDVHLWPYIKRAAAATWRYDVAQAKIAARAAASAIVNALTTAWNAVMRVAQRIWHSIGSVGRGAVLTLAAIVGGPLVSAWSGVRNAVNTIIGLINTAKGAVSGLIGFLNHALDIANSVVNAVSLGHSSSTAGRTGQGGNSPGAPNFRGQAPNVVGNVAGLGGNVAVIHVHGADLSSAAHRRVVGAQLGDTLMRRWAQQAGR